MPPARQPIARPLVAPVEQWYVLTEDGTKYGPIGRADLNQWSQEGRLTAQTQVLLEGAPAWQWAPEIYPHLQAPPSQAIAPPTPGAGLDFASPASESKPSSLKRFKRSESVNNAAYASYGVAVMAVIRGLLYLFLTSVAVSGATNFSPSNPRAAGVMIGGTIIAVLILFFALIIAIPYFLAGMGVSGRKQWGRILSLVMGGFSVFFGLVTGLVLAKGLWDYSQLMQMGFRLPAEIQNSILANLAMNGFFLLVWFGHAALNYTVLLNRKNAQEFR